MIRVERAASVISEYECRMGAPQRAPIRLWSPAPRNHPDLRPEGDLEAEVGRLLALGARRVDVGQSGEEPFVVFADPEGNEFCLLRKPVRGDR